MDGTLRFLLITMLATAATATYEYDAKEVRDFLNRLYMYNSSRHPVEVSNEDALLEWNVAYVDTKTDVHFEIAEYTKRSGHDCGGGPAMRYKKFPYCLLKITFHMDTRNGKEVLQYSLIFRSTAKFSTWSMATSYVYVKTADYQQIPEESVFVEPISKEHLVGARYNTPFQMNTAWLNKIFADGLYLLKKSAVEVLIGNVDMDFESVYYTSPIVMDAETVNEIVHLASLSNEEPPKNEITDVEAHKKTILAEWEEEMDRKEE